MKNLFKYLILLSIVACTNNKHIHNHQPKVGAVGQTDTVEGVINGGGGKGALCTKDGQEKIEVLDIYEGRYLFGNTYQKPFPDNKSEALKVLSRKYLDYFGFASEDESVIEKFEKEINDFVTNIRFTKPGQRIKNTKDAFSPLIEDGCESVQLAVYYNEDILLIDKDYWDKMDWRNRSGLILHEIIYLNARLHNGQKNSMSSRKITGDLMSDKKMIPIREIEDKENSIICYAKAKTIDKSASSPEDFSLSIWETQENGNHTTKVKFLYTKNYFNFYPLVAKSEELTTSIFIDRDPSLHHRANMNIFEGESNKRFGQLNIEFKAHNLDIEAMLTLEDSKEDPKKYLLSCGTYKSVPKPDSELEDITMEFFENFGDKHYKAKDSTAQANLNDSFSLSKNSFSRTVTYHVGNEDDKLVPYGTSCTYRDSRAIEKILVRNLDSEYTFLLVKVNDRKLELVDSDSSNPLPGACETFIKRENEVTKIDRNSYDIYLNVSKDNPLSLVYEGVDYEAVDLETN